MNLDAAIRAAVDPPEVEDLEPFIHGLQRALLAVINAHIPVEGEDGPECAYCCEVYDAAHAPEPWPCGELRSIAEELGIEVMHVAGEGWKGRNAADVALWAGAQVVEWRMHPTFTIRWSDEDQEWVATAAEFPSLSWLDADPVAALDGLGAVIRDSLVDVGDDGDG